MGSNEGDISVGGFVVKVTSQSVIKPSSPTPPSRRRFQLSLFDRLIAVDQYATFLSFYPAATGEPHAILRGSLSEALSRFYPFAGEIKLVYPEPGLPVPSSSVDCNDRGVVYLEAEANQTMAEFLGAATPPSRRLLEQHLAPPRPVVSSHAQLLPMAAVKTTVFRCGGVAVGACLSHLVADADTFAMLFRKWAAAARNQNLEEPKASGSSGSSVGEADGYAQECLLFQADEGLLSRTLSHVREHQRLSIEKAKAGGKVETQRLVFTGEAISALKSQLMIRSSSTDDHPSRTVAIAGLIWKAALDARSRRAPTASAAVSLVNVRPRLKTPLPDGCIGNLYWITTAVAETSGDPGMEHFASRVKESVGRVDGELLEKLAAGVEAHRQFHEQLEGLAASNSTDDSASLYKFSSILRMGLSQVDFGWGKPSWVTILGFTADDVAPVPNLVCLMEATAGGGAVEAWVSLDEQEMPIFLQHPHLLQYATVNPRIHLIP